MADSPSRALSGTVALVLLTAIGSLAPATARAGLEICNKTEVLQSVSIGYKGETDWTSEGWWNIAAGDCVTPVTGDLKKRYYYYFAKSSGKPFESQDYDFCTQPAEFTIVGDTDCEKRGYTTSKYREIDTGETATEFTLTISDADPVAPEQVDPPDIAASGKGPGGGRQTQGASGPVDDAVLTALHSGIAPGTHGTAMSTDALFQGCELEDSRAYCSFHANGAKLRVFYGGTTPDEMLFALEDMAVNTPVRLEADRVGAESLQMAVVLRDVTPMPGGDPDADLRAALQGDWLSAQDQRIGFSIIGSELYTRFEGKFRGVRFVQLAATCDAAKGAGPVLLQTKVADKSSACYVIDSVADGVLELTDPGRGAHLRYVADR